MCCLDTKDEMEFYKSPGTRVWIVSGKRVLICKSCVDKLMNEYAKRYGEQTALSYICALLDLPYVPQLYRTVTENNSFFAVGLYSRLLNGRQWANKSFVNSIIDGEFAKDDNDVREEVEARWSRADKQNMAYVKSVCGYDPFLDLNLTQADRKYAFNVLAGYLDIDGVREDPHKMTSIIAIVQAQIQIRKIDENINAELLNRTPDEKRVKDLTESKNKLLASISQMAKDNAISSLHNVNSTKGAHTLSRKMKDMMADGFRQAEVNLFNIKTCDAMKQIANLSNASILEQLALDANDYTEMLVEQRALIQELTQRAAAAEEDARMLKNKLLDLENNVGA